MAGYRMFVYGAGLRDGDAALPFAVTILVKSVTD